MRSSKQKNFTSFDIAKEMRRNFREDIESLPINMRYKRQIGRFIRKIERAHKKTDKSKLIF